MMMIDNLLKKRYLFAGQIHTPRSGDLSILSVDQREDHNKNELQTSRQNFESQPEAENLQFDKQNQELSSMVWRSKCLRILYFVSKFLTQLKHSSNSFKFRMLTKKLFDFINDSSSDYSFYIEQGYINKDISVVQKLASKCRIIQQIFPIRLLKMIPIIYPDSKFRIIFDTLLVLSVILNIFFIPIRLAFTPSINEDTPISFILESIPSWLLLIEIPLNFNTAFYFNGVIHIKRNQIVNNYFRGQLFWDVVISFPYIIQQIQPSIIIYVLLLRVTRIKIKFDNIEKNLNLREKFPLLLDLGRLIYFVMIVSHFCACSWYQLAKWEEAKQGRSWLSHFGILDKDLQTKYINSLYFCTITITTVGYGDITPITPNEMIFTTIMTLVTCGVFGYAINNIGIIFQELERKEQLFKNQMAKLSKHLKRYNLYKLLRYQVGQNLQLQIKKYYEYQLQKADEDDQEITRCLKKLPQDLRISLNIDKYSKILLRSKFLRENVSTSCLNELCQKAHELHFSSDDVIFERNQLTRQLYFIQSGEINIVIQKENSQDGDHKSIYDPRDTILRRFKQGYVLGEKNFLLDVSMEYQASANQRCSLLTINFEDFIAVLKTYPLDYERFCLMRDTLKQGQQYRRIVSVCEICAHNHSFMNCPFTFHQPNRRKIIQINQKWTHNPRRPYRRSKQLKFFFDQQNVQYSALSMALHQGHFCEDDLQPQLLIQLGIQSPTIKSSSDTIQHPSEKLIGQVSAYNNQTRDKTQKTSIITKVEQRRASKRKTAFQLVKTLLEKQYMSSSWKNIQDCIDSEHDLSPLKSRSISRSCAVVQDDQDQSQRMNIEQPITQTQGQTILFDKPEKIESLSYDIDSFRDFKVYKPEENLSYLLWQLEATRQRARSQFASQRLQKSQHYFLNKVLTRIRDARRNTDDQSYNSKRTLRQHC